MTNGRLFDRASYSDGLEPADQYAGGWVSTATSRSGGVTIIHADSQILVDSEHIYMVLEGKAPSWVTLRAPAPALEKKLIDCDDIRQAGTGAFVGWEVRIAGDNRSLIYLLSAYRPGTDSYEAGRLACEKSVSGTSDQ